MSTATRTVAWTSAMTTHPLLIVVLAAGKGMRMRSRRPKVLHAIAGRSMLAHALATARSAGAASLAVVVAPGMEAVRAEAERVAPGIEVFEQAAQLGTGNAVLAARPALERHRGDVIVLFADTPLVEAATLRRLVGALDGGAQIAALGFEAPDATGYGRLVLDDRRRVQRISRAQRRQRGGASHRPVQRRRHGLSRARPCRPAGAHRQRQREGRILSHRCGGDRGRGWARHAAGRLRAGGGAGHQFARAAGGRRGRLPEPRSPQDHGGGRDADRARDRLAELRYGDRPRRDHRAQRVLRAGRGRRGRRPHHGQLPPGGRAHRQGRPRRPLRALPPRRRHRRERARRQLRRGEERAGSKRAPRPIIWPTSATAVWARAPTSAPARSSATTTASTSTSPTSARAPSSAPTRRWWRR